MNNKTAYNITLLFTALNILIAFVIFTQEKPQDRKFLNPIVKDCVFTEDKEIKIQVNPPKTVIETISNKQSWKGTASYYSRAGCVGCHPQMIMANGEPLDDTQLTVAFNKLPLNTTVRICNAMNGECTVAKVTDTGGFERLGRIIDLGLAVKEEIKCSDLCEVKINEL